MSIACQACGTMNEDGSGKCAVCGAALAPAMPNAPAARATASAAPPAGVPRQPAPIAPGPAVTSSPAAPQARPAAPAATPRPPAAPVPGKGAPTTAAAPSAPAAAATTETTSEPSAAASPEGKGAEAGQQAGLTGELPAAAGRMAPGGWQTHPPYPGDLSSVYPWGTQQMAQRAAYPYPYPPIAMPFMFPPYGMYGFPPMWGYPFGMPYMSPYGMPPGYGMSPYGAPGMGPYPGDGYGWQQPRRKRMRPWAIVLIVVVVLMVIGGAIAAALLLTRNTKTSFNLGSGTVTGANIEFSGMTLRQNGRIVTLSGTYANNTKREGDVLITVTGLSNGAEQVLDFTVPVSTGTKKFAQQQSVSYTLSGATLGSMVFEATSVNNNGTYPYQNSTTTPNSSGSTTSPYSSPTLPNSSSSSSGTDGSLDNSVDVTY